MMSEKNIDWQAAYSRLHIFLENYSGSKFIKQIQKIDPGLLDYNDFIEKRRKEEKSTTKKVYFRDILLSYPDNIKHKFFNLFMAPYEGSHPKEISDIRKILSGGKIEIEESAFSKISVPMSNESLPKEIPLETSLSQNSIASSPLITESLPTVVILTAINEEYMAVREHLTEIEEITKDGTHYEKGAFVHNSQKIASVIIRECGAKNTIAAQETERAIQFFKPRAIFFVGIAGSRKPHDFAIGDVIIPEKIYSYEGGKADLTAFVSRPDLSNMTYTLLEIAKTERRKSDWKSLIKGDIPLNVKADLGVIASGEKLVEHSESNIGKILKEHFNDTSAVEMEGFGFAKAASRQGQEMSNMLIGVIRGISDVIQQSDSTTSSENKRPANAKVLASNTAAAFAFWLILKYFLNNANLTKNI